MEREVEAYLRRKHPAAISAVELVEKEDLDLKNHLSGLKRRLMKARAEPARLPICAIKEPSNKLIGFLILFFVWAICEKEFQGHDLSTLRMMHTCAYLKSSVVVPVAS